MGTDFRIYREPVRNLSVRNRRIGCTRGLFFYLHENPANSSVSIVLGDWNVLE